jgi:hypothetical protein
MKQVTLLTTIAVLSISAPTLAAEVQVGSSYNTKSKAVTPVVTVSQDLSPTTKIQGFVNFKSGGFQTTREAQTAGKVYVEEAAYDVFDAEKRFGIVTPKGPVDESVYSYDGTRIDGQPISGLLSDGTYVKANRTLVTAVVDRAAEVVELPKTEVGVSVLTDLIAPVSIGAGVKTDFSKVTPFLQAAVNQKLSESISFFTDVKVPLDSTGVDLQVGVSLKF